MVAQQQTSPAAPIAPQQRPAPQQLPANPNTSATQQVGLPTLSTDSVLKDQLSAALAEQAYVPRTKEQILADEAFFTPESLKSPAGMAELARLNAMNERYEGTKSGRGMGAVNAGLEALMRGGNYGSGAANQRLAYEAADVTQADARNKALTAIETVQRAEDTAKRTRGLGALDTEAAAGRKSKEDRRKDLTTAYGNAEQAIASKYTADAGISKQVLANMNAIEVAKINSRASAAAANRPDKTQQILAEYFTRYAKDPKDAEFFMKTVERLELKGNEPRQTQEQSSAKAALPSAQTALKDAERTFSYLARLPEKDPSRIAAQQALNDARERLRVVTAAAGIGDSSPVASGIAAPAPRITPADFSAKWSTLRPGQKLVGPDGVEYIKSKG
jgi:hypothetical protein